MSGEPFCVDCPDHEACATGAPCDTVKRLTPPAVIDAEHIQTQLEWSTRTFGPGIRPGVVDHIRKELVEIEEADYKDLEEWIDVIILAIDGAWRAGHLPQDIIDAFHAKQRKNRDRTWPDWRTADRDKAIEHDRTADRLETPIYWAAQLGYRITRGLDTDVPITLDAFNDYRFARRYTLEQLHCRWCGGPVGPRIPGDRYGIGCLNDINHIYNGLTPSSTTHVQPT